jgi:hypothetical protein
MDKEKILKLINQIENGLVQLKIELGLEIGNRIKKTRRVKTKGKKLNLEMPIKTLLGEGFFSEWRKDTDVVQKLKEKILTPRNLRRSSVTNVLRRFFAKGLLDRKEIIEGKKKVLVYKKAEK